MDQRDYEDLLKRGAEGRRRICACLALCEGLPTDHLEAVAAGDAALFIQRDGPYPASLRPCNPQRCAIHPN